jgi:nucleoside-diphosphate-sugar epimerase
MVLVTGSTGFVGRHIVKELCYRGVEVRCLVRSSSKNLAVLNGLDVKICYGDVNDQHSLEEALEEVEAVVQLVAIIRETKQATFHKINFLGTKNLVLSARRLGVRRLIFMSNLGACPDQRFPIPYFKWLGEEEVRNSGMDFTIFRPSVIFGKRDGFITVLANIIKRFPIAPVIGSGNTRFQPISVKDVATCVFLSLQNKDTINQVIHLAGPEHLAYKEIIDLIIQTLKIKRIKLNIPVPIMKATVWAMERLLPQPPVTSTQLAMLNRDNITDLDVVERAFGFKPVSLRERIEYILT